MFNFYVPYWLSLLMMSVTRVNPLQTTIALDSGLEDSCNKIVDWVNNE